MSRAYSNTVRAALFATIVLAISAGPTWASESRKLRIGIAEFEAPSDHPGAGAQAANELAKHLRSSPRFVIVEARQVEDAMRRLRLAPGDTGGRGLEIGKLAAAEYVCFGGVTVRTVREDYPADHNVHLIAEVSVSLRVVQTERATVVYNHAKMKRRRETQMYEGMDRKTAARIQADIQQRSVNQCIRDDVEWLAEQLAKELVLEGHVLEVRPDGDVVLDLGLRDGIEAKARFQVFSAGETAIDPATGSSTEWPEAPGGTLRAVRVEAATTLARPDRGKPPRPGDRVVLLLR